MVLALSRRHTRRTFLVGGAAAAAIYGFYHWLDYGPHNDMLPALVERAFDVTPTYRAPSFANMPWLLSIP